MSSPLKKFINNLLCQFFPFVNRFFYFVLLAVKDVLFTLSQVFRSFRSWLMCLFTFFNDLSDRIKLVSSAKWWAVQNLIGHQRDHIGSRQCSKPSPICPIGTNYSPQVIVQPAITCSKLTKETLEQGVEYVQI